MEQIGAALTIAHGEDHGHTAGGTGHTTVKDYPIGFVLAATLTAIPFKMVVDGDYSHQAMLVTVIALAVVQIVVRLIYFLHLDGSSTQCWNMVAFLFALLILVIVIVGSLWIIHNMNVSMIMI